MSKHVVGYTINANCVMIDFSDESQLRISTALFEKIANSFSDYHTPQRGRGRAAMNVVNKWRPQQPVMNNNSDDSTAQQSPSSRMPRIISLGD